jgi:hypothetical protein
MVGGKHAVGASLGSLLALGLSLGCSGPVGSDGGVVPDYGPACAAPSAETSSCPGTGVSTFGSPGICNASGAEYCGELAGADVDPACRATWGVYAFCLGGGGMPGACVRASTCGSLSDAGSCRCGDGPACLHGQLCAAPYPGAVPSCTCAPAGAP